MFSMTLSWRTFRRIFMAATASASLLSSEANLRADTIFPVFTASGTGSGSLFNAIKQADAFGNGATISIQSGLGTINTGVLPDITVGLTINGGSGNTLSGQNQNRIFFINAPGQTVSIQSLTLSGGLAQGGSGGSGAGAGGGGAGLGGAAFINSGSVSFQSVSFVSNSAQGGAGGGYQPGGGGGGGGMGFAGGAAGESFTFGGTFYLLGAGGGGGARTSAGVTATGANPANSGGAHGGASGTGSNLSGGSVGVPDGGGGGGAVDASAFNPAGSFGGFGGNGGDFGGGGGSGSSINNSAGEGGNGGFGAGGGGGADAGPGFAGNGGNGGFGGGGGGGGGTPNEILYGPSSSGDGGFGAGAGGDGNEGAGGGGAALGAGVFVRSSNGASVSFSDTSFDAGTLTAGGGGGSALTGHSGSAGSAAGGSLFLMGGNTTFGVSPGNTETIAGTIAQSSASSITVTGGGVLSLTGNNAAADAYSGGTTVTSGELSISADSALGAVSGSLTLNGGSLQITGTTDHSTAHTIALGSNGGGFDIANAGNGFNVSQALGGAASLTKTGPGALVLSGANSYSGSTTVSGGSLALAFPYNGSAGTLAASSTVTVDSGAVLQLGSAAGQNNVVGVGMNAPNVSIPGITINNGGTLTSNTGTTHNLGALNLAGGVISGSPSPTSGFYDFTFNSPVTVDASTANSSISAPGGIGLRIGIPFAVSAGPGQLIVSANLNDEPGGSSGGVTKNGAGTMLLEGNDTYTLGTIVNSGVLIFGSHGALPVNSALTVNGGTAQITNLNSGTRFLSQLSSLSFGGSSGGWTGQVDLTNTDVIVHNGDLTKLTSQIGQGFNNGAWNGDGITTSAAVPTGNTALGIELNSNGHNGTLVTSFDGQTVSNTDVLIKYTFFGDANLDGVVNSADYLAIDNGFNSQTVIGWQNGDFNYDGKINGDDYTLIDNAFNTQGSVSFASNSAGPAEMIASATEQTAVPEPGSFGLLIIFGLFTRDYRRQFRKVTEPLH